MVIPSEMTQERRPLKETKDAVAVQRKAAKCLRWALAGCCKKRKLKNLDMPNTLKVRKENILLWLEKKKHN